MAWFQMPFTDNHQLNLDFILSKYKKLENDEAAIQASLEGAEAAKEEAEAQAAAAAESATAAADSATAAAASATDAAETVESINDSLNQINVNTERINNLVANAGDTDGNAELLDIRVGYNGETYDTAGDAVRGQVDALSIAVNPFERPVLNRTYMGESSPSGTASNAYLLTDLIDTPETPISVKIVNRTGAYLAVMVLVCHQDGSWWYNSSRWDVAANSSRIETRTEGPCRIMLWLAGAPDLTTEQVTAITNNIWIKQYYDDNDFSKRNISLENRISALENDVDAIDIVKTVKESDVDHVVKFSQHIKGNLDNYLTLVHFSDLHADTAALGRISDDIERIDPDDSICTGDIVYYHGEPIENWWNADIMTCIGNHDSATYDSQTGYNWTGIPMATRAAYYIDPFKTNWNIVHQNGKSYYHKDYTNKNVRIIVIDAMLYVNNDPEGAIQTSWLENLLADAITNNLHVLIATHAPHGGSTAESCSFTDLKYYDTMPVLTDSNTPLTVINAVSNAINNGLQFIGYICGHIHTDMIWNATNDGKQKMFGVTTAATYIEDLWKNSDQYRDVNNDAYNIITVDTTNTVIKIVRGGGADLDNMTRIRKGITFNYATGEILGEIK